jgi:Putative peptidoglycan binding domain/Domain of unknown function DUF11
MLATARLVRCVRFSLVAFMLLLANALSPTPVLAQNSDVIVAGDAAVTRYAPGPEGAVLQIIELDALGGDWSGKTSDAVSGLSVKASEIGQVFGLALDNATPPNVYVTATSAHGLKVEGEGKNARWAPGQFGPDGGPGSIWKIDGTTGEVALFANVKLDGIANSGPGLGNIAFDPVSEQLFVSDRDTGMIHRFDRDGNDLGHFDHGVHARPTTGLEALAFDPANRLDTGSDDFSPDDPATWGYAAPGRAVWGLAVNGGRLYYAVEEGPQVWSVSIGERGEFGDDARLELDLPPDVSAHPIADIAFTADRKMVLAQRGGAFVSADGPQHHQSGDNAVIVFALELPDDPETPGRWLPEPDFMPVGKTAPHRNAAGGVSLGHGYGEDGEIDGAACMATLWATGDALGKTDDEGVDGLVGQRATSFEEQPDRSVYLRILEPGDEQRAGLMGDIEIFTDCAGVPVAELPDYEAPDCPGDPRCLPPIEELEGPDLELVKIAQGERCKKGQACRFTVLVRNVGSEAYYGPITFEDTNTNDDKLQSYGPTPPWTCAAGDFIAAFCRHGDAYIEPGDGIAVDLTFTIPEDWTRPTYRNCAQLSWAAWQGFGDINPDNDESCDWAPVCQPGEPGCGPDLLIEQVTSGLCEFDGFCRITTRITNVGGQDYSGPLSFEVADFTPGLVLQNYDSAAEWSCGATGAENYQCYSGPVTLRPGESREVAVSLAKPPENEGDAARQCVSLRLPPGADDGNAYNNYACADLQLCREGSDCPADLAISFGSYCAAAQGGGATCYFNTWVTNRGAQPFPLTPNAISIVNDFGSGLTFTGLQTPFQLCESLGAGSGKGKCTSIQQDDAADLSLPPGRRVSVRYRYDVSGLTEPVRQNCAKIDWAEGQTDLNDANDEHCAPVRLCRAQADGCPVDLVVDGNRGPTCLRGYDCSVNTSLVYNAGNAPFAGSFTATMSTIPGLAPTAPQIVRGLGQPVGQCAVAGNGQINCASGQTTIPPRGEPGAYLYGAATYAIPGDFARDSAEICLELTAVNGPDADKDNNRHCVQAMIIDPPQAASIEVEPGIDLAVTKRLLGSCRRAGATCRYRITVANEGGKAFSGDVTIADVMSPATARFEKAAGPWNCRREGMGRAYCVRQDVELQPGAQQRFDVSFAMAQDAAGEIENCARMEAVDGDSNAENDQACVTVSIDEEAEPEPPAEAKLDLAISLKGSPNCKTRQKCNAQVTVRNVGEAQFSGPLTVHHGFNNTWFRPSGGADWTCSYGRRPTMRCTNANLVLAPGGSASYRAKFVPNFVSKNAKNHCVTIDWAHGGGGAEQTRQAQAKLNQLGFDAGTVDGQWGARSQNALKAYQKSQGLRPTGNLDSTTVRRLLAIAVAEGDSNRRNDKFCLEMNVTESPKPKPPPRPRPEPPQPPKCSGGSYWNGTRCVCPETHYIKDGRCLPRYQPPPPPKSCPYQGQIRLPTGQCFCPPGTKVINGRCRKPATACTADKILRNGQCVCRPGWSSRGGICQPNPKPGPEPCPRGMKRNSHGVCQPAR